MADDYLTPDEFAALPVDAQCAVWSAHAEKRVQVIRHGQIFRYHREQVQALLNPPEAET